jgi:hypothetical protein
MAELIVTEEDWPHGLRCLDCNAELGAGTTYSKRLVAVFEDSPIVELVCAPCGLGLKSDR